MAQKTDDTLLIRDFIEADLDSSDALLNLAFRSSVSRLQDLRIYRQVQPDGWLSAIQAEKLVGMVGAISYSAFAHVGLMAVHPDMQRQGIGLALMRSLLTRLEQALVPAVWLDASKLGRPLYEKLGFVTYDETCVFQRQAPPLPTVPASPVQRLTASTLKALVAEDTCVFGADRGKVLRTLLEAYPGRAFLQRDEAGRLSGYLIAQKNRIGPWVMLQPQGAEALLQAALALPFDGALSVYVPSGNQAAIALLQRYGFERLRSLQHMGRGAAAMPGQRQEVFAEASLTLG